MPFTKSDVREMRRLRHAEIDAEVSASKAKWEQADFAHGLSLTGGEITAFATEVGMKSATLKQTVATAAAWPKNKRRKDVSFTVHRDMRDRDDRFGLIMQRDWTATTLREFLGQPSAASRRALTDEGHNASATSVARRMATDPAFAQAVMGHGGARVAVRRAERAAIKDIAAGIGEPEKPNNDLIAGLDFRADLRNVKRTLVTAVETWQEIGGKGVSSKQRTEIVDEIDAIINAAGALRDGVTNGQTMDEALVHLLSEGA